MATIADTAAPPTKMPRATQTGVCTLLLAAIGASAGLLLFLVHYEPLGAWMDRQFAAANDTANFYARHFLDVEDRVLIDEIPRLDCSSGGAYFFGASNMKWATKLPELPAEQQRLIHNFAAGEAQPPYVQQFLQYLIDYKHLLQAGPEKTLIIYGTSFLNSQPLPDPKLAFFNNLWPRYGLYEYHPDTGIRPAQLPAPLERYYREKARITSFVQACMDRSARSVLPKQWRRRTGRDPAGFPAMYARRMGDDWQAEMKRHGAQLAALADFVHGRGMAMTVVLLPLADWHRKLPYPAEYEKVVDEVCRRKHVPLADLSRLVPTSGFNDHIHLNEAGRDVLEPALLEIARTHLRHCGALAK
jgi:hypothetical protein